MESRGFAWHSGGSYSASSNYNIMLSYQNQCLVSFYIRNFFENQVICDGKLVISCWAEHDNMIEAL